MLDSCYEIVAIAILTQVKPMANLSLLVCTLLFIFVLCRHCIMSSKRRRLALEPLIGLKGISDSALAAVLHTAKQQKNTATPSRRTIGRVLAYQVLTVITYLDEIIPGNVLHPDNARKSWAVYMSCLELPQWMLQLEDCWLAVAVIRTIASDHRKRKIYSGTIASDYVA